MSEAKNRVTSDDQDPVRRAATIARDVYAEMHPDSRPGWWFMINDALRTTAQDAVGQLTDLLRQSGAVPFFHREACAEWRGGTCDKCCGPGSTSATCEKYVSLGPGVRGIRRCKLEPGHDGPCNPRSTSATARTCAVPGCFNDTLPNREHCSDACFKATFDAENEAWLAEHAPVAAERATSEATNETDQEVVDRLVDAAMPPRGEKRRIDAAVVIPNGPPPTPEQSADVLRRTEAILAKVVSRKCDACATSKCADHQDYDAVPRTDYDQSDALKALIREALAKGAERRCPWCWTVAHRGKHAPDCRAIAAVGTPKRGDRHE